MWRLRLQDLPYWKSVCMRQLRVFVLALRGYVRNQCIQRASSLTFYTLLSIVPVFAMIFGIAKGFGFEKRLERQLYQQFGAQEEVLGRVIGFSRSMLHDAEGGLIAGVGLVVLFWSVIKVLGYAEASFNEIWKVRQSRSWGRKFSDYLSIMLIAPILVVLSSSVTVFIRTRFTEIAQKVELFAVVSPLVFFLLKLTPYLLIWVLFSLIYLILPNTKVSYRSAVFGGVIGGTLYQIAQWAYIAFQIGAARYNAIYGSFAALPLFLMWVQLSWWIVLFGAELCAAYQNVDTYEFAPEEVTVSPGNRKLLSLYVFQRIMQNFRNGDQPLGSSQIAKELEMPIYLVNRILGDLVESGLVSRTLVDDSENLAYQAAQDIHQLTISSVLRALDRRGLDVLPVAERRELRTLENALQEFQCVMESSEANRLLIDIT